MFWIHKVFAVATLAPDLSWVECFQMIFAVALVGAQSEITKITAYVNDTVVLPSGAAEGETLKNIEWSIFLNNTYIATYGNKTPNVDWIYQFKGRLNLNSSSGKITPLWS